MSAIGTVELESGLKINHELIKGADQKTSIFLAFLGIFLPLTFIPFFNWVFKNYETLNQITQFFFLLAGVLAIWSLFKTLLVLAPVLGKKEFKGSLIYFGDIASMKFADFKRTIRSRNQTKYKDDLEDQIYITSKISYRKHIHFQEAVWLFLISLVLVFTGYINILVQPYV